MTHDLFATWSGGFCPCLCQLLELGYGSQQVGFLLECQGLHANIHVRNGYHLLPTFMDNLWWGSVSGLTQRPFLPNISSMTHLHLISSCVLLLRVEGKRHIDNGNNKNRGYSFLFILVGTGMAVAKLGKLAEHVNQEHKPETHRRGFVSNALSLPYKSTIYVFSKRLELIPSFQNYLLSL